MSIILNGINMPKEDEVMVITVWGDDKDGTAFISNKEPMTVVPINAIQIPNGHGKIVDLDDLVVKHWDGNFMIIDNDAYDDAPAILESEGTDDLPI